MTLVWKFLIELLSLKTNKKKEGIIMKNNHAAIDNVICFHKPGISVLLVKDCTLVSVEYCSGKTRHYFPCKDTIPKHIYNFIGTSLIYPLSGTETLYKYGNTI